MCQQCHLAKEEIWAEVRDLVEYGEGPLSTALKARIDERREMIADHPLAALLDFVNEISPAMDDSWTAAIETIRCIMIAQRLAFVASFGDSHLHGEAPSIILGTWGGDLLHRELHALATAQDEDSPLAHSDDETTPLDVYRAVLGNMIEDYSSGA